MKKLLAGLWLLAVGAYGIPTVAVGDLVLSTTSSNTAVLELQLQKTDDLTGEWEDAGEPVRWEIPLDGNEFFKVTASGEETMAYELTFETIDASTCKVSGYTGTPVNVVIPAEHGGRDVVELGGYSFRDCVSLVSIDIPDTVISLGTDCFDSCTSLVSIDIPDTVVTLGYRAFWMCTALVEANIPSAFVPSNSGYHFMGCTSLASVTIPDNLTTIGRGTFWECSSLRSVELPSNLTSLEQGVFRLSGLESIDIPASVTSIDQEAFGRCYNLTNITIPSNVTTIGVGAFYKCTSLTSIVMEGNAPSLGAGVFDNAPATIYYPSTATGYTNPWGGRPTVAYVAGSLMGFGSFSGSLALSSTFPDSFPVDNGIGLGEDDYLALLKDGTASGFGITSNVADVITLDTPVDRTYTPSTSSISPLLLSRFEDASFEMSFVTDELAIVSSKFLEVPKEYADTTSGATAPVAYLYEFDRDNYDTQRFTSHERDIFITGGNEWEAQHFEHSDISENVNLEKTDVTLNSRIFEDNPLGLFIPLQLESVLHLTIMECSPGADGVITSTTTVFKGQVSTVSTDGPLIQARCAGISTLFDRMVPNVLIQPTCNFLVFSPPCGLLSADWKMGATVVEYPYTHDGVTYPYKVLVTTPAFTDPTPEQTRPPTTQFEHYFAGGKIEFGEDDTYQSRSILDSETIGTVDPNVLLTIRHPLKDVTVDTTAGIWAGCDGRKETCLAYETTHNEEGKFGNYSRFGGFPFVPIGNPSLAKINKDHSEGGKK